MERGRGPLPDLEILVSPILLPRVAPCPCEGSFISIPAGMGRPKSGVPSDLQVNLCARVVLPA